MKKLFCLALLSAAACCYAEEIDDDLPHFEGSNRAFLFTITQDIHSYRNEDKLMMEKKTHTVKAISPPKITSRPFKVKMDVKLKNVDKMFSALRNGDTSGLKNGSKMVNIKKVQVTTKTTF